MQKILITNCVAQNGGDAAILMALIGSTRQAIGPMARFVVVDDHPEAVAELFPELRTRPRLDKTLPMHGGSRRQRLLARGSRARLLMGAWLLGHSAEVFARFWLTPDQYAALREFCEADAVISTGGTYMVERYDIQGRLLELEAAVLMKRPLILFTQSLGPFSKPGNRRAIRRVANRARLVLLRDETSRRHLTEIGVAGPHLHVVPDGVFAFPLHAPAATDQVKHIAISVRDWPYADDAVRANTAYRNAIGGLATHLIHDRGVHITFLSTCQGTPNYWTDDSAVAVRIAEDLGPDVRDSVTVDQTFHTPEELVARLADFDLVIATRMHMAILSLVAGVPVFPIAYEFKTQELFEHLGLGVWVRDFDAVASPGFAADVDRFIDTLPEITNGLWSAVRAEHASAVNTVGLIRTALAAAE